MNDEKYIVIQGNPVDGMSFYGPFDSNDDADRFADEHLDADWWLTPLISPSIVDEVELNITKSSR